MSKANQSKTSGYTAVHELPFSDELEGNTVIKAGSEIPDGALDEATAQRLLRKGAIRKSKDVQAEQAEQADASDAGDDAGKGETPGPAVKSRKK